jgi:hypothetical protein
MFRRFPGAGLAAAALLAVALGQTVAQTPPPRLVPPPVAIDLAQPIHVNVGPAATGQQAQTAAPQRQAPPASVTDVQQLGHWCPEATPCAC